MAPSYALLFMLLSFLLLVESQNTNFSINAFTPHSQKVTYQRDAFVPPDETYVRLAGIDGTRRSTRGRVLYSTPVKLWGQGQQASFETTITLQITPVTTSSSEGMTFFIVPVNSTLTTGGYGGNLGIYDALVPGSPLLAVEIDCNSNITYDPQYSHMGININSIRSQNYTRLGFNASDRKFVTMSVTYDVPTRRISAVATVGTTTTKVSFVYDLKILLPQEVQVGLSASTGTGGSYIAYYDIFTWHFNSTLVHDVAYDDTSYIKQYVM